MPSILEVDQNMKLEVQKEENGLVWHSTLDKTLFHAYGSMCYEEKEYQRLCASQRAEIQNINPGVAWLSSHPAGVQLKFETDSTRIQLEVTLRGKHDMSHMPATGQCGFDLYVYDEQMKDYVLHSTSTYDINLSQYTANMLNFPQEKTNKIMRKYILNFPLYMGVSTLNIGLDEDALTHPLSFSQTGRIVLYGTSIAQGGCVSRPGMLYTNILSRWLDCEFINLGFSGSAFAEKIIGKWIGDIPDQKAFVVDVEANAGCDKREEENLEKFLDAYFVHQPNTPVILVTRTLMNLDRYDTYRINLHQFYREFTLKLIEKYQRLGHSMYFLDGDTFFSGYDLNVTEFTVDGVHPTDLGNYCLAKAHKEILQKCIEKKR